MSVSFTVKGTFLNGRTPAATLHWPGDSWSTEFEQRKAQYAEDYRYEIESAMKAQGGMASLTHFDVFYRFYPPFGDGDEYRVFITFNRDITNKLRKKYGISGSANNQVSWRTVDIIDMSRVGKSGLFSKAASIEDVLDDVRQQVNSLFERAFGGFRPAVQSTTGQFNQLFMQPVTTQVQTAPAPSEYFIDGHVEVSNSDRQRYSQQFNPARNPMYDTLFGR